MFELSELQNLLVLINRTNVGGQEVESVVALKQKISGLIKSAAPVVKEGEVVEAPAA